MSRHHDPRWRLWSGCCEPFVLWRPDGEGVPIELAPVSSPLKTELLEWHVNVAEHLADDGWDSPAAEQRHAQLGRGLQQRLQRELDVPVELDLSAARVGW